MLPRHLQTRTCVFNMDSPGFIGGQKIGRLTYACSDLKSRSFVRPAMIFGTALNAKRTVLPGPGYGLAAQLKGAFSDMFSRMGFVLRGRCRTGRRH